MPATDPDKNKPKPGHKHLNLPNVPTADLQAIAHAAITAGQTRTEYLRELIHADAEKWRSRGQAGKATGYRYTFDVADLSASEADELLDALVQVAGRWSVNAAGGMIQVDDDGNQVA
jgi:hypothetical protein